MKFIATLRDDSAACAAANDDDDDEGTDKQRRPTDRASDGAACDSVPATAMYGSQLAGGRMDWS